MVLPQAMAWVQYWFRVLSLRFCGKSKKNCGDISQLSPAFCMYVLKIFWFVLLVTALLLCLLSFGTFWKLFQTWTLTVIFAEINKGCHQGSITCGAIDEPRKSSIAIDKRVIINLHDKNVVIALFRDKNVIIASFRDKNEAFILALQHYSPLSIAIP